MPSDRTESVAGNLARLGFADPERARGLLADPALAGLVDPLEDVFDDGILGALGAVADPDLALLTLTRLAERLRAGAEGERDPAARAHLLAALRSGGAGRERLLAVLGGSAALGDHLVRHPEHWLVLVRDGGPQGAAQVRAELLAAVGADPGAAVPVASLRGTSGDDALRVAYRRRLVAIAGRDLADPQPARSMPAVAGELADLAAAALEAALAVARAELPADAEPCRLAVIGMGKCGGRELNYVSDVDVVYVAEPVEGGQEGAALETATRLATRLAKACSAGTGEGTLWPVDAGLRPEGRNGPLVRTLASHRSYYERWAKTWEFQALLKARPVAGDQALGREYLQVISPMVWLAAGRDHFVEDVQAMRRRVEQNVDSRHADRQLKLGPGGLRDVEFSVQLLQLVHGRTDEGLRSGNTLEALRQLSAGGYVGRQDAAHLDASYRFLRSLEHRLQLHRLRRTHVVPTSDADLRRLGRSLGERADPVAALTSAWRAHQRDVRGLHERLFYRPLLASTARLSSDEVRLTPEAARARLAALGYRDPAGAVRHLEALTEGVSRRAAIQRTLLPVLLGWFADGADPDAGLLSYRRVSDALGSTHWYLKLLRDSGAAAERFSHVLAASRMAAQLLERSPESVRLLADDAVLTPRGRPALDAEVAAAIERHSEAASAAEAVRAVRARELLRTAVGDLVGGVRLDDVGRALSDAAGAALAGALQVAVRRVSGRADLPTRLLVVGMGRLGGQECGYTSDADVLFVHQPVPGADEEEAQAVALDVVTELRRLLATPAAEPALEVDPDLRPEGRSGPLVRTLGAYATYYQRWSSSWEAQALTRARPVAGDEALARAFLDLIEPVRWPDGGLPATGVTEIRRVKARVEAERLPRGVEPRRHLKLGPGGLSDVEWTVQLLQLRHAHEVPGLRTTSTVPALQAAGEAGLLAVEDANVLVEAWTTASRARNAVALWRGRGGDVLPTDRRDLDGVARILGYPPGSAGALEEDLRRIARRSRAVVERAFYA